MRSVCCLLFLGLAARTGRAFGLQAPDKAGAATGASAPVRARRLAPTWTSTTLADANGAAITDTTTTSATQVVLRMDFSSQQVTAISTLTLQPPDCLTSIAYTFNANHVLIRGEVDTSKTGTPGSCSAQLLVASATPSLAGDSDPFAFLWRPGVTNFEVLSNTSSVLPNGVTAIENFRIRVTFTGDAKTINGLSTTPAGCAFLNGIVSGSDTNVLVYDMSIDPSFVNPTTGVCQMSIAGTNVAPALSNTGSGTITYRPTALIDGRNSAGGVLGNNGLTTSTAVSVQMSLSGIVAGFSTSTFTFNPAGCGTGGAVSLTTTTIPRGGISLVPASMGIGGVCTVSVPATAFAPPTDGSDSFTFTYVPTVTSFVSKSVDDVTLSNGETTSLNFKVVAALSGPVASVGSLIFAPASCGAVNSTSIVGSSVHVVVTLDPAFLSSNSECEIGFPATATSPNHGTSNQAVLVRYVVDFSPGSVAETLDSAGATLAGGVTSTLDVQTRFTFTSEINTISSLSFTPNNCGTMGSTTISGVTATVEVSLDLGSLGNTFTCAVALDEQDTDPDLGTVSSRTATFTYAPIPSSVTTKTTNGVPLVDNVTGMTSFLVEFTFSDAVVSIDTLTFSPTLCGSLQSTTTTSASTIGAIVVLDSARLSNAAQCTVSLPPSGTTPNLGSSTPTAITVTYQMTLVDLQVLVGSVSHGVSQAVVTTTNLVGLEAEFSSAIVGISQFHFVPTGCAVVQLSSLQQAIAVFDVILEPSSLGDDGSCDVSFAGSDVNPESYGGGNATIIYRPEILGSEARSAADAALLGPLTTQAGVARFQMSGPIAEATNVTFAPTNCATLRNLNVDSNNLVRAAIYIDYTVVAVNDPCSVTLNPSDTMPSHGSTSSTDNTVTFIFQPNLVSVDTYDATGSPTNGATDVTQVQAWFVFSAPVRAVNTISANPLNCATVLGSTTNSATIVANLTLNVNSLGPQGDCTVFVNQNGPSARFEYHPAIESITMVDLNDEPLENSVSETLVVKVKVQFSDLINSAAEVSSILTNPQNCLQYRAGSFSQDTTGLVEFELQLDHQQVDQTTGECNFDIQPTSVVPSLSSSTLAVHVFYNPRVLNASFWDPSPDPCQEQGAVRLVGSVNANEGAVQVCHLGNWKGVCDDNWGLKDAQVVCRQIGAGEALAAPQNSWWSAAIYAGFWMENVDCDGTESTLFGCRSGGVGRHNCGSSNQAGVECEHAPTSIPSDSRVVSSTRGEEWGFFRVALSGPIVSFNPGSFLPENLFTQAFDPNGFFGGLNFPPVIPDVEPNSYLIPVRYRTGELADIQDPFSIRDFVALTLPTSAASPPLREAVPRTSIPYRPQIMWMDVRRFQGAGSNYFANFSAPPSDDVSSAYLGDDDQSSDVADSNPDFTVLSTLPSPSHDFLYVRFSGRVLRVLTDAIRGNGMTFDDGAAVASPDGTRWMIPAHLLVGTLTNTFPPRVVGQASFQVPKTAIAPNLHGDSFFTHIAYSPDVASLEFLDSNGVVRAFAEDDGQTGTIRVTFSGAITSIQGAQMTTMSQSAPPTPNADRTVWTFPVTIFTNPANMLATFQLFHADALPPLDVNSNQLVLPYRPRVVLIEYLSLADEVLNVIHEKNYEGKVRFTFSGPMASLDTTKVTTLQVTFTGAAVQTNGDRVWTYPATLTVGNPVSDPIVPGDDDNVVILTPLADRASIVVNPYATVPRIREESARFTIPYVVQVASTRFLDASLNPITTFRASGTYFFEIQFTDTFREFPAGAVQFSANAEVVARTMPAADTYLYELTIDTDAAADVVAAFTASETEPASEAASGFTLTYVPRLDASDLIRTDSMSPVSSSNVAMDARLQLTFSGRVTAINTASISLSGLSITGAFTANAAGTIWTAPVRLHLGDVSSGAVASSAEATILPAASTPTHEIAHSTPTVSYVPIVTGVTFLLDDGMGAWTAITSSALRQPGRVRIAFSSNVASVNTAAFTALEGITFNAAVTTGPANEWTFDVQFNTGGLVASVLQDDAAFTVATAAVTPNTDAAFPASIPYRPRVLSVAFLNAADATLTYSNADQDGFLLVTFSDRVTSATLASFTLVGVASRTGSVLSSEDDSVWKFPVVIAAAPVDPEVTIPTTAVVPNLVAASNVYTIDYRVDVSSIVFRRGAATVTTFREDETIVARVTFTDPVSVLPANAFSVSAGGVVDGVPAMFGGVGDVWDVPVTITSGAPVTVSFVSGATTPETNAGGAATMLYIPPVCELQCGEGFCVGLEEESRCVCNPGFFANETTLVCQESTTPRCDDGLQNGRETDVDCGRSCATRCASGRTCRQSEDCESGLVCLDAEGDRRCAVRVIEQGVYVRVQDVKLAGLTTAQFTGSVRQAFVDAVLHTVEGAEGVTIDRVSAYTAAPSRMRALQAAAASTGIAVDLSVSTALDSGVRSTVLRQRVGAALGAPVGPSSSCSGSSTVLSSFVGQVPALSSSVELDACGASLSTEIVQTSQDRSSLEAEPDAPVEENDSDDEGGAIAGIVIACIVVGVFGVMVVLWLRRRSSEKESA